MTTKSIVFILYTVHILRSTETGKFGSKALKERYCITYLFQSGNFSTLDQWTNHCASGPNITIATAIETVTVCLYDNQMGKDYIQLLKRRLYQV